MSLPEDMTVLALAAKNAARLMPRLSTDEKNRCLNAMANALEAQSQAKQHFEDRSRQFNALQQLHSTGARLQWHRHRELFQGRGFILEEVDHEHSVGIEVR